LNLEGVATLECEECLNQLTIDGYDIDIEAVSSSERGMGTEVGYEGTCEYVCPKCHNEIVVRYEAWEYPVGSFNYGDTEVSGGSMITGFRDLDFSFEEEIYSFDEQTNLYIPEPQKIITNLEFGVRSLIQEISHYPESIYNIKPREFEELIAHIFGKAGFEVQLTKKTRDGGRDIIALKNDLGIPVKYIIECKRYARDNKISVDVARSLYGVQMQEGANKAIIATTSYFTKDTQKFVSAQNTTEWAMALRDYNDIIKWVKDANNS